uniref:Uncharacterized protein n=1 Tax=Panagrolaimus sp. ES5 TaxID=591445 RepID=A0AC34GBJ7_9BILA
MNKVDIQGENGGFAAFDEVLDCVKSLIRLHITFQPINTSMFINTSLSLMKARFDEMQQIVYLELFDVPNGITMTMLDLFLQKTGVRTWISIESLYTEDLKPELDLCVANILNSDSSAVLEYPNQSAEDRFVMVCRYFDEDPEESTMEE